MLKSGIKIIQKKNEGAKALNELCRHKMIEKLEKDILQDLMVCEIEGFDKMEYLEMLRNLINGFFTRIKKQSR